MLTHLSFIVSGFLAMGIALTTTAKAQSLSRDASTTNVAPRLCFDAIEGTRQVVKESGDADSSVEAVAAAVKVCQGGFSAPRAALFTQLVERCQRVFTNARYREASCELAAVTTVNSMGPIPGVKQDVDQYHLNIKLLDLFPDELRIYEPLNDQCVRAFSPTGDGQALRVCELNAAVYVESLRPY